MLQYIQTKDHLDEFISNLRTLSLNLFKTSSSKDPLDGFDYRFIETFKKILYEKNYQLDDLTKNSASDKGKFESVIKSLMVELSSADVLSITLAFSPTQHFIEKMHSWCSANVCENLVISINEDSHIMGGVILSYKGNYRDYSVRSALGKLNIPDMFINLTKTTYES
jgi:hypothetical protein